MIVVGILSGGDGCVARSKIAQESAIYYNWRRGPVKIINETSNPFWK